MKRLALALCFFFSLAHAQEPYPSRGIRLVIDTSPGGVTDLFGRLIAEGLSQKFPQGVFVDNKPGASGNLAIDYVVRGPADGYTLMMASGGGLVVKPFLERGLTFDVTPFASRGSSGPLQARRMKSMSSTGSQRVHIAHSTCSRFVGSMSSSTTTTKRPR